MARSSTGFVAGITAAALAVVGFLAYQASASAPPAADLAAPGTSASPSAKPSNLPPAGSPASKPDLTVPANSGTGVRVVYALSAKRVWLVGVAKTPKTFAVVPSAINPKPGTYVVLSRTGNKITGSDGVAIDHVVRFASNENVAIGFSSAVDGSMTIPKTGKKAGGIRMTRADGDAMWTFATRNSKVVVVP
ncbi:hypothetical protein AB0M94_18645 [Streptomyces xanthochromogenes]|uniref:Secreted protein n=1 Tax=Streptomyces xanthochromogenes TaxID=67384 RepID=A0ABQ3A4D7_9ACTN|nr:MULTISPECIES: hypothetical protein [Streptomyces]GGY32049.1 hypothetical protein GCM10010326_27390 [Streptomyces xanthochromogenes]